MNKAIEVENFTKHYKGRGEPAVDSLSFAVEKGSFHGLIGANGSGKTTTIKSIIRAFIKYEGTIKIDGSINSKLEARKKIGYIPERANFPSGITTKSYLYHMAKLSNMPHEKAIIEVQNLLKRFGLEELSNKKPTSFSSGQKKKVLLAQALIHKPEILIMDEPAANLDPIARREFFDTLQELNKDGITIFITSHILAELDNYITSVTIINNGQLSYTGPLENMKKTNILTVETYNVADANKVKKINGFVFEKSRTSNLVRIKISDEQSKDTKKIIDKILKVITPKSYFIETISLQDIYNRFVVDNKLDVSDENKRSKFNIKRWLW